MSTTINQVILKDQTDYQKQNLISINWKTYEYVNKALRLHKNVKNILRRDVGGVPANYGSGFRLHTLNYFR